MAEMFIYIFVLFVYIYFCFCLFNATPVLTGIGQWELLSFSKWCMCFSASPGHRRAHYMLWGRVLVSDLWAFQTWIAQVTSFICQDVSTGQGTEDQAEWLQEKMPTILPYGVCWSKGTPELVKGIPAINQLFLLGVSSLGRWCLFNQI